MRPAILIIIMDFLVSSLLLFISGPDNWRAGGGGTTDEATEFTPAAVAAMEEDWLREARDALIGKKILTQDNLIANLTREADALAKTKQNLETEIAAQKAAIAARQREIASQKAETQLLRQEQARLTTTIRERENLIASQQESIAALAQSTRAMDTLHQKQEQTQQSLREIQNEQKALTTNIASIQISGALTHEKLDDVTRSQAAIHAQLGEMEANQAGMAATLQALNAFATNLPLTMQTGFRNIADNQLQMEAAVAALTETAQTLQTINPMHATQGFADKLDALATQHQALHQTLRALISGQTDQLAEGMNDVRQNQDTLASGIKELAAKVEELGAKQPGPFRPFRDARLELRVALSEEPQSERISARQIETYVGTCYPPLLTVNGQQFLVATARDLGLNWIGISERLRHVFYRIAPPDGAGASCLLSGPLLVPDPKANIILIGVPDAQSPSNALPLTILGRAKLEQRELTGLHLFKRSSRGLSFAIEASLDMSDTRHLLVRRLLRPWVNALRGAFINPNMRPEPGDFVVTEKGEFVGIMSDDQRCFILAENDLFNPELTIPLDNIAAFAQAARDYRRNLK